MAHSTPLGGSAPIVRPGDVVDVAPGVEPGRRAGYRLHVTDVGQPSYNGWNILRGYVLNRSGARRGDRAGGARTCWLPMDQLVLATVNVQLGVERRPVPLAVSPGEERPLPLLPVLTWEQSAADFDGAAWPISGAYLAAHLHRHDTCGHLRRCGFPDRGEPCQAYECHDHLCWDCTLRQRQTSSGR